jgi:serine/threonine protein kinase
MSRFIDVGAPEFQLLHWMLQANPNARPTAKQALNHPYFAVRGRQTSDIAFQNVFHDVEVGGMQKCER